MSHLAQLKQQIKAIQTTQKITHAIRLVSMSLYTKLEKGNKPLTLYTSKIRGVFSQLVRSTPEWKNHILFPGDVFDATPLFIVVASSRGLCGSLNSNLSRYLERSLFIEEQQTPRFITIGQKALKWVRDYRKGEIICSYTDFNSHNYQTIADNLVQQIMSVPTPYSSVAFFCTEFKTFFAQRSRKVTLIPFTLDPLQEGSVNESDETDFIWEQEATPLLDYVAQQTVKTIISETLFQALLAEYASRFIAMDNSSTNAEKYLEKLTLAYNKMRQGLITKEVSELSSGFLDIK